MHSCICEILRINSESWEELLTGVVIPLDFYGGFEPREVVFIEVNACKGYILRPQVLLFYGLFSIARISGLISLRWWLGLGFLVRLGFCINSLLIHQKMIIYYDMLENENFQTLKLKFGNKV